MGKRFGIMTVAVTVGVMAGSACATKKFVRAEVGDVNTKITSLGTSLEATHQRTRQNEARIADVDGKADAATRSALEARAIGDAAGTATRDLDTRLSGRMTGMETAARRLVFEVTLSEDQGNFGFGGATMPDDAKARLDAMIGKLKADPAGGFIEVEGYTDNIGGAACNERLGLERAETVKRYLHEQHQVALHKINVIGYGEANPVAPNTTRAGRAQNRRVVVRVLS